MTAAGRNRCVRAQGVRAVAVRFSTSGSTAVPFTESPARVHPSGDRTGTPTREATGATTATPTVASPAPPERLNLISCDVNRSDRVHSERVYPCVGDADTSVRCSSVSRETKVFCCGVNRP